MKGSARRAFICAAMVALGAIGYAFCLHNHMMLSAGICFGTMLWFGWVGYGEARK